MTRFAPDAGQHDILDDLGLCNAEREMQRFVTVTIVAPLTYPVAVTPRSERVGFNSQRSWAFIPSRSFERCAAAAALGQTQALKFGRE